MGGNQSTQGGGGAGQSKLQTLLSALRADLQAALLAQAAAEGWPAPVEEGHLFVSTNLAATLVAGDHDAWAGTALQSDEGFLWAVVSAAAGNRYKLTDGQDLWLADPWSRAYNYDDNGEISLIAANGEAHLERHFAVTDGVMPPRKLRLWIPAEPVTHLLYVHDGQNLFDPKGIKGGWKLQLSAPPAMMLVGIDNTSDRMDEYTHVEDDIGAVVGGKGDAYGQYVHETVRPLIAKHYGEPSKVGLMGSSLGGLISLHIADLYPNSYLFAASLSGTVGWGSIGPAVHNETIIERYASHGHQSTALYIDSGGSGNCVDSDQDGIDDDDPNAKDNYCENKQLEATLETAGYIPNTDLWHWHEPGALHDEEAWAERVWRPLQIFAGL